MTPDPRQVRSRAHAAVPFWRDVRVLSGISQLVVLGAVLLQAGRASEAEAVYWEDLRRYPHNGWSLFGLAQSLRKQGKNEEAALAEQRFQKAWAQADVKLTASRF